MMPIIINAIFAAMHAVLYWCVGMDISLLAVGFHLGMCVAIALTLWVERHP